MELITPALFVPAFVEEPVDVVATIEASMDAISTLISLDADNRVIIASIDPLGWMTNTLERLARGYSCQEPDQLMPCRFKP